jgi:hypothetical protein
MPVVSRGGSSGEVFVSGCGHVYGEPCRGGELDALAQQLLATLTDR